MKEFKTIDQLVALLESRGVEIDMDAAGAIRRESYYAIVNGYKSPFLDRAAMQSSPSDVYKPGTRFSEIYDLFLYDRDLRNVVFPYLTRAEAIIKNAVVYAFCERHPGPRDYLDRSNYVRADAMLVPPAFKGDTQAMHKANVDGLVNMFNRKMILRDSTPPFVRHYLEKYSCVPLWVLQNDLTFGNIEHFYQLQERGVQNAACKIAGMVRGGDRRIGPLELLRCATVLVGFRNVCAHDERLYCAEVKSAHYADMVKCLWKVLPPDEVREMVDGTNRLIAVDYRGRLGPSVHSDIIKGMRVQIRSAAK